MSDRIFASVAVLTYNGREYIELLLDSLYDQEVNFKYEVIVIDSGSHDDTVKLVEKYPVRLYKIKNEDFNHGETRNYAASLARGELVAFLTQDAIPAGKEWLKEIVKPFQDDAAVACVFGRHIAREDAFILTKRDMENHFLNYSDDNLTTTIQSMSDIPSEEFENNRYYYYFFSDVNSCIRKSIWKKIPYRKLDYSEDQAFGMDVINAGYKKAYNPRAAVYHSHDYPLKDYLKRQFDEFRGLKNAIGYADYTPFLKTQVRSLRCFRDDCSYIIRNEGFNVKDISRAFFLDIFRGLGIYLGARNERLPVSLKNILSLESSNENSRS